MDGQPGLVARAQNLVEVEIVGTDQLDPLEAGFFQELEAGQGRAFAHTAQHECLFPGILGGLARSGDRWPRQRGRGQGCARGTEKGPSLNRSHGWLSPGSGPWMMDRRVVGTWEAVSRRILRIRRFGLPIQGMPSWPRSACRSPRRRCVRRGPPIAVDSRSSRAASRPAPIRSRVGAGRSCSLRCVAMRTGVSLGLVPRRWIRSKRSRSSSDELVDVPPRRRRFLLRPGPGRRRSTPVRLTCPDAPDDGGAVSTSRSTSSSRCRRLRRRGRRRLCLWSFRSTSCSSYRSRVLVGRRARRHGR